MSMILGSSPPYSNTGALNTFQTGLTATIDWISVTFKVSYFEQIISEVLRIPKSHFIETDYGINGYTKSYQRGEHIKLFYHPEQPQMGYFLQMPGQGCRLFESWIQGHNRSWNQFFQDCLRFEAHFTRIDIALDDHKPYFRLKKVWQKIKRQEVISKLRTAKHVEDVSLTTGRSNGITIYLGSTNSRQMIRLYEKGKERFRHIKAKLDLKYLNELYKAKEITMEDFFIDIDENPYYEDIDLEYYENWNRYELVCKKQNAENAAYHLSQNYPIGDLVLGILSDYMRIANKGNDTNRSRWDSWQPWEKLIQNIEKVNISMNPKEQTIFDKELWIRRSIAPSLQVFLKYLKEIDVDGTHVLMNIINQAKLSDQQEIFLETVLQKVREEKSERKQETVILKKNPNA